MQFATRTVEPLMLVDRGGVRLAVDGGAVEEVMASRDPATIPHLPPHLLGLVPWRARALPVLDLAPLLGLPATEPCTYTVVLRAGGHEAGLLVERVRGLDVAPPALEPVPAHLPGRLRTCTRGVLTAGHEAIVVLDLALLLAAAAIADGRGA